MDHGLDLLSFCHIGGGGVSGSGSVGAGLPAVGEGRSLLTEGAGRSRMGVGCLGRVSIGFPGGVGG